MDIFITHISTACVLFEIGSVRILTDPVFDEGERDYSFGHLGIGATRRKGPALKPHAIPELDAMLLSHTHHSDNLDDGGRSLFPKAHRLITNSDEEEFVNEKAIRLTRWQSTTIQGQQGEIITVTATPALHGPRLIPESKRVCGFVLEWAGQENGALYISGDTVYFNDLRELPERFKIGTALVHLGAVYFYLPICRFTFNSAGAVNLAKLLNLKRLIPIHYEKDVWSHFKESVASYQRAFREAGLQDKVTWLEKGVRTQLSI